MYRLSVASALTLSALWINSPTSFASDLVLSADPSAPSGLSATSTRDDFDSLIVSAYNLYIQKKYNEALAACEKAAELRPTDNRPYAISGLVYMAQWKMKSASEALAKAISYSPNNEKLHYAKAQADRYRNAKEEGLVSVRRALELNPSYADAYLLLGNLLGIGSGNYKEQIEAFRKAIELKPNLLEAYRELGMVLKVSKDEKGAEEAYRKAMEIDPKKMASRFDLGRLLVKQGRLAEAREVWNKRSSDEDKTFPNFIAVLERSEKFEAAKQAYAKSPNDPEVILRIGMMTMDGESWVVDGRQERAIVYFKKALEIKPDLAKAQHAICMAYVQMADTNKEKNKILDEELAKLRKLDPKLADDIVEYRKKYSGGIKGTSITANQ